MTAVEIGRLLERAGRLVRSLQFAGGLNPAQWDALRYVARANLRSRTPSAVADYLGATKGTASQTLSALEEKGLVHRRQDGADRRCVSLELTAAGRAILVSDPLLALEAAVGSLPCEDQAKLGQVLERLLRDLSQRRGGAEFGLCEDCGHLQGDCERGSANCGLLDERLTAADLKQLCVDFQQKPEPSARR